MVTINKIYTKTGDKGETSLVGGRRLPKDNIRIESYGTVDELNTIIGIVRSFVEADDELRQIEQLSKVLLAIQQKLFDLGSELATHQDDSYEGQIKASENEVKWLESIIDHLNQDLQPLKSFVLPGGNQVNAYLHQARTVCRRAERRVIQLSHQTPINPMIQAFLNRLSDLMFAMARWVSKQKNIPETLWQPKLELPVWI